jgi:uncharacterized membrane protein YedE/YeeE
VKPLTTAFLSGTLFAVGLGIAGMTQPAKVTAFLDVAGNWDPSLAFVMLGAIAIYAFLFRAILQRGVPLSGRRFFVPTRRDVDARLILGAAIFGVGWGLGGFCPGPAVTSLVSDHTAAVTFSAAMITGMAASMWMESRARHAVKEEG